MKSKLLALLSALLIAMLLVTSCGNSGTGEGAGEGGSTEGEGGSTEGEGGSAEGDDSSDGAEGYKYLVYDMAISNDGISAINVIMEYQKITNVRLTGKVDTAVDVSTNIISLGDTGLAVSDKAIYKLERLLRVDKTHDWDSASYVIYSDGSNVSIYWDDDYIAAQALNKFYSLVSEGEKFAKGFLFSDSVRTLAVKEAEEAELREESLAAVEAVLGKDAAEAIGAHVSLADDRFYLWLADLYEPRTCVCEVYDDAGTRICQLPKDEFGEYLCHGGGFYYSNSARDNEGFNIDIESTVQVINFLSTSGMLAEYGNSENAALPAQMKADIVAFARSLQSDEDGYFYHPQWGTGISTSRRGRDMGWATQVLEAFGAKPLYNAPNGTKGELGAPGKKSALTSLLSESTVVAVSKVQLAATAWPEHLKTLDAFTDYLKGFDLENKSYNAGNTLTSQAAQIKNRDKEGLGNGEFVDADKNGIADGGFIATFESYMNSKQYAENGLWEAEVHYNSVNGLMKIGGAYNTLGIKLPNAQKALNSSIEMVLLDPDTPDVKEKSATGSVDVYNPWVAISQTLNNMNKHGSSEDVAAIRATIRENAAAMISVTTEKTRKFAKADGSYGYTWTTSPANSQNAPVAVPGTVEGDVNGGIISIRGIYAHMKMALGIGNIAPNLYYPSDFDKFIYRINRLQPVIKHTALITDTDPYTFEDEQVGSEVFDGGGFASNSGVISVAKDPTNETNLALKIEKTPSANSGATLSMIPKGSTSNKSMLLLEWDMYVESGSNTSTAFQIRVGESYMFTIGFKDGTVIFGDSSSTTNKVAITNKFDATVAFKTWFKVRIEAYPAGDGEKALTKFYLNDELVVVSDNYYGKNTGAAMSTSYNDAKFYSLYGSEYVAYFDNIHVLRSDASYSPDTDDSEGGDSEGGAADKS